ncbi:MAG: hypothetical protein ACLGGV_00490 [Bacteroidia bacterium]
MFPLCFLGQDSLPFKFTDSLFVGKRKNFIWDRKIDEKNLGDTKYTYYYPIYYNTNSNPKYQYIGLLGGNIKERLFLYDDSKREFIKYRNRKTISFVLLPAAIGGIILWVDKGAEEVINSQPNPFLSQNSLPYLGIFFAGFMGGIYINTKADLNLRLSVTLYNSHL